MNIYDISKKAGVSIATVSRVLNNSPHVSEATRRRVMRIIDQNGYVPNAFARGLGLGSMKTIGLLCPDASDPYLASALAMLEGAFRKQNYNCLLSCTGNELPERISGIEALRSRHVDGLVLMGSSFVEDTEDRNAYIREAAAATPTVLLNGSYNCEGVYSVLCDDKQATHSAVATLARSGCKRILYLYHSRSVSGVKKLMGYREGLAECGLPVDDQLIRLMGESSIDVQQVRDKLLALRAEGLSFDAVLTSEDRLAIGAMKYARAAGLRIPEDVAIIGYNNSSLCVCSEPELTSVDNQLPAICDQVVQTMMGVLEGRAMPRQTIYTAELRQRASSKA